jgi:peptidoglycan/LPS O-acetylase OafA/YrhL
MSGSGKPSEIRALSGARAIPPLILVLFHYCEGHGYRGVPWFDLIVSKGYLWVEFFFALSGFILVHVYSARLASMWNVRAYSQFVTTRLARLYPLHLFMMLAIFAQFLVFGALARAGGYISIFDQPYHPILSWPTFVANLFLVQAWNLFPYLSWNNVAWFVSVEFLLCLLFPIYLSIARGGLFRGIAVVVTGAAVLLWLDLISRHGLDLTFHNGIWRGMAAFGIGVGLVMIFRSVPARATGMSESVFHSLVQTVLLALLLGAIWFSGKAHSRSDILTVLPMMALVLALAFDRGFLAAILKMSLPMRLGEWSYAIYIGQTFWLQFSRFAEQRIFPAPDTIVMGWRWADLTWWSEPAALVLICVAWGALLSAAIERPASDGFRRLIARHSVRSTAAA